MRKLVFVHGRAQEGKDPVQLRQTWINALKEGLAKNGLRLPIDERAIAFPFYGDRLDQIIAARDDDSTVLTRGRRGDELEIRFTRQLLDEMRLAAGITDRMIIDASGDQVVEKGPLSWGWVHAVLRALDRVPGVSSTTVNLFTRDVYVYLHQPGVRDEIDKLVRDSIPDNEECVVVGHSLGAIVTFGILRRDERHLSPVRYVTVGAPLALTAVRTSFEPLKCPMCVKEWFNAKDARDVVALHALEPPHFNVTCGIINKKDVKNPDDDPHGIVGYLADPEVSKTIYEALVQ